MDLNKKKLAEDIKKLVPEASTINVNFGKKRIPLPPNIMVFQTFAFLAATELKPATNKVLMLFFAYEVVYFFDGRCDEQNDFSCR